MAEAPRRGVRPVRIVDDIDVAAMGEKNMNESSLPEAGWYPAAHAGGQSRYWNGTAWAEDAPRDSDGSAAAPSFWKRTMSRKAGVITAASALVVGLALGGGVGGSNAQNEIGSLQDQVSSLEGDVGEAQTVARETDTALVEARADLDDALAKLAKVTGDLTAVTAQVTEMQTAATASQTELDARAARITDLEGQLSVQAAPVASVPEQSAPVSSSGSVWFKNCTAAREAGAAPVRVGDPGYAKHLDRDGDGIGCE